MDLDFLRQYPQLAKEITFNIKGIDLLNFADKLVSETARNVEQRMKEQNKPDQLLTRKEVGRMLGVTLSTLWHWDKKDILKPLRIGTKVRYRLSDIQHVLGNK